MGVKVRAIEPCSLARIPTDAAWPGDCYTSRSRRIRLVNMLTSMETILEVAEEETLWDILQRHLEHNAHAASYVWKYGDRLLEMDKTLQQNGVSCPQNSIVGLTLL